MNSGRTIRINFIRIIEEIRQQIFQENSQKLFKEISEEIPKGVVENRFPRNKYKERNTQWHCKVANIRPNFSACYKKLQLVLKIVDHYVVWVLYSTVQQRTV